MYEAPYHGTHYLPFTMNMWANLDTLSLGIYVVDGKVVSVYWQ